MVQLTERFPPPSKANDQMAWTAQMNNLLHSTEEIILKEILKEIVYGYNMKIVYGYNMNLDL